MVGISTEDNKNLIRQCIEAVDDNQSSDWSILDEYIARTTLLSAASWAEACTKESSWGFPPQTVKSKPTAS